MHYLNYQSVEKDWQEGLLILMYHAVDVPPLFHGHRGLYVTPNLLAHQLRELKKTSISGFTTLDEWKKAPSSSRQVVVTFDDAYLNLFTKGLPVLQELGIQGLTYAVGSFIGKANDWEHAGNLRREMLMDRAQLSEWGRAGHQVGSHGLTHRDLTTLSPEEARREIVDSKKLLEDLLGQPVRHFCYPYGAWNEAVRAMVEEAGYETATSTLPGFNTTETDAFILRRLLARHERPYLAALLRT